MGVRVCMGVTYVMTADSWKDTAIGAACAVWYRSNDKFERCVDSGVAVHVPQHHVSVPMNALR